MSKSWEEEWADAPKNPENWDKLDGKLAALWRVRGDREHYFGDAVSVVRGVLRYYRWTLTWQQMGSLIMLHEWIEKKEKIEGADLRLLNAHIRAVGLDPFCCLSGNPPPWRKKDCDSSRTDSEDGP